MKIMILIIIMIIIIIIIIFVFLKKFYIVIHFFLPVQRMYIHKIYIH